MSYDNRELQVIPWRFIEDRMPKDMSRGLYSVPSECALCGEVGYCILLVMSGGHGLGPVVSPFCIPCVKQLPDGKGVETDPRFFNLGSRDGVTTFISDPKQWKTRP